MADAPHGEPGEVEEAQERVLEALVKIYARTGYGLENGIEPDMDMGAFREAVRPRGYAEFKPYVGEVLKGGFRALLTSEPEFIGITSGTTGPPKLVPIPSYDVEHRLRAMGECWSITGASPMGPCIAPCLPSSISSIRIGDREVPCGYISGINAEIMARLKGLGKLLRPYIEEVNRIGPGVSREVWDKRFRALLKALEGLNARMALGAAPALWMFARWLRENEEAWPKELWDIELLLVAGVPGIWDYYRTDLMKMYGEEALFVEAYGATEGLFAISLPNEPYLVPLYGSYLFEVRVGKEVKMLYEMKAGEVGSIIISTPVFPRYEIGDLIACYRDGLCFRVLGRDRWLNRVRIRLSRLLGHLIAFF